MKLLPPHKNTFKSVMVDLTHRCNMNCANCYIPNRDIPDMDVSKLRDCLAQLPFRTDIRLVGAEPTMRSDLPEIIDMIRSLGHRPNLLSNGLRLARETYVRELFDAGLRQVYISLNGADNDDWYEHIDNLRCAKKKIKALENVARVGMLVGTGTIIVRNVNEGAVKRAIDLVKQINPKNALMRFRNVGALGRFDKNAERQNLSMPELENMVIEALGHPIANIPRQSNGNIVHDANIRIFPVDPASVVGRGIWIKLTDWQIDENGLVDPNSTHRGRITPDFQIAPFFEHVKANEGGY